jgi:hypothetical protein
VNHDPPIFGWESPVVSLPIYFPITEKHTWARTHNGTAAAWLLADAEG